MKDTQVEGEEDENESDEAGIHPEHGGKAKGSTNVYTNTSFGFDT
jgi:hypothetical protein